MDVREKLVELLTDNLPRIGNLPKCDNPLQYTMDEIVERIANHLIANGVTAQEWISTDERMPTEDDATDGYVAVVYDGEKTVSLVDVVIAHPDLYDYWMPLNLPQPPKGE